MPVTGVPLPFVSYGGSSMFAGMLAIGLLQNVHLRSTATEPARYTMPRTRPVRLLTRPMTAR
jgi:rod shape determining protein RodA